MGKISKAMKMVPEAMKNLGKIADEVSDASQRTRKALQRTGSGSGTSPGTRVSSATGTNPSTTSTTSGSGSGSGPVKVKVPEWATKEEVRQFERYVEGSNRAVAANALSKTGRVATTKNGVRKEAEKAAYAERKRAEQAGTPYQGVAGHVPDATWMGKGEPYEWHDITKRVNSSLAGQANGYPIGYKPTKFEIEYPPSN